MFSVPDFLSEASDVLVWKFQTCPLLALMLSKNVVTSKLCIKDVLFYGGIKSFDTPQIKSMRGVTSDLYTLMIFKLL